MLCLSQFHINSISKCLPGRLTKADRELIVVATSIHNKCLYCVVSHSALHRIYSKKPTLSDQVSSLANFHSLPLLCLLQYTITTTEVRNQISEIFSVSCCFGRCINDFVCYSLFLNYYETITAKPFFVIQKNVILNHIHFPLPPYFHPGHCKL